MTWAFDGLKMFGYDVLVIDPPWHFELYSEAGNRKSASAKYDTMPLAEIMALPVGHLARGDCLVLLWVCAPMLKQGFDCLDAWGAVYKTELVWAKKTRNGKPRMGPGYRARSLHESILLATFGNPKHKPLNSLFDGVAREHSRKPEEFYARVERAAPKARRADLFSRKTRPGWDGWGREKTKFDNVVQPALPAKARALCPPTENSLFSFMESPVATAA